MMFNFELWLVRTFPYLANSMTKCVFKLPVPGSAEVEGEQLEEWLRHLKQVDGEFVRSVYRSVLGRPLVVRLVIQHVKTNSSWPIVEAVDNWQFVSEGLDRPQQFVDLMHNLRRRQFGWEKNESIEPENVFRVWVIPTHLYVL